MCNFLNIFLLTFNPANGSSINKIYCNDIHSNAGNFVTLHKVSNQGNMAAVTTNLPAGTFADSKPHYQILDGLRGVAALVVLVYHIFECFSSTPLPHGYLAVDLFFVLSGFVIGYAYDDRWGTDMTMSHFFKRRLIRLHPVVLIGAILGAITFLLQGSVKWDGSHVATSAVMLAMLCGMFMIPTAPGTITEVRGNGELFPLNGPSWSLFFEYIGNILYALLLRKLKTHTLGVLAALLGVVFIYMTTKAGYLGMGWTMADNGLLGGFVRMMFPYTMGMFMARLFRPIPHVKGALWMCGAVFIAVALVPTLGDMQTPWLNGLFDAMCVIVIFPALVWIGASDLEPGKRTMTVSRIIGDLSYPLYAIHYPFMYLFYNYIGFNGSESVKTITDVWPMAIALGVGCIVLAWLCLKFYDLPVRRWLAKRWLKPKE